MEFLAFTNIKNDFQLTFHKSSSISHFQCLNIDCAYITRNIGKINFIEWAELTPSPFAINADPLAMSILVHKVCHTPPLYLALYNTKI